MKTSGTYSSRALLTLLVFAVFLCSIRAQETLTVYDGTTTDRRVPMYVYYFDDFTRSQYVIPATDLEEMNGGSITAIKYYTSSSDSYTTDVSVEVYLKEVSYTSISAFEEKSGATTVYQGTVTFASGETTITFATPYDYNGGNLLIGIENTTDGSYKSIYFYGQNVSGASVSGCNGSSLTGVSASQENFIPKTTFTYSLPETSCPKPTDLEVSTITPFTATLTWQSDMSEWNLKYKASDATDWTEVNGITDKTYTLSELSPETSYQVRVQAVNDVETSRWVGTTFTTPINALVQPTELTLTAFSSTTATLSWTESGIATSWQICIDGDETNLIDAPSNSYTLTGLTYEQEYTAKVRGISGEDRSAWSDEITFTPTDKFTLGTASRTDNAIPFCPPYKYSLSEQIYSAEEFGGLKCTFTGIDFYNASTSNDANGLVDIYLMETDKELFNYYTEWVPVSDDDLVYSGSVTLAKDSWTTIPFTTPFVYNGTKNVILVVHDYMNAASGGVTFS